MTLARTFFDRAIAVGVGVRLGGLNVYTLDSANQTLFTRFGASPDGGVVWMPTGRDFRLAASGGFPFNAVSGWSHPARSEHQAAGGGAG